MSNDIKARVLVVDDEKEFLNVFSERLRNNGLAVSAADDGKSAINKIKTGNFDAVILDLYMPGMDGMKTLEKIQEINPDMQIIMLTGHASSQTAVKAIKEGAFDYLEKPVKIKELLEKIDKAKNNKIILLEKKNKEAIEKILRSTSW